MTWVIAATSPFGHGAMISDVKVTLQSGATHDLIQKAFRVGNYIVAGFAGSVLNGYRLLDSITLSLRLPPELASTHAWEPAQIAKSWAPIAKTVFEQAPLSEQKLGSQFLVLGVSPTQNAGAPEFARAYMVRFSAPDFTPGFMHWGYKVCSIGTGASVDRYKQVLRPYFDLRTLDSQVETVGSSWWGKMIANAVGDAVEENSERGISRHFHVLTCRRGQILASTNDITWFAPDGTSETCIAMPPVATSYQQFQHMVAELGSDASCAVC